MQNPIATMTKETLDSNRVNYLIWRYLQESNYKDTAVKLQSEWDVEDPQKLDFAPNVKDHALVSILQRGLLYNEAERKAALRRPDAVVPTSGFFGSVAPLSPPLAPEEDAPNARKRSVEERPQPIRESSPTKRSKLSNGHENGILPIPMDIEETAITNGNGHAYPSPKEVDAERSLTPVTFTNGPEKGTQVAKITDLSDDTTYLTLADTPESANPVLLHCEWSPRHNTRLATAGIDTLTRLWTVPSPPTEANGHVTVQAVRDLVEEDDTRSSVSFIAWTNNGDAIAVASDCDGNGKINVWSKEGTRIVQYNSPGCPPILCLRWNPSSTLLLAMTAMEPKGGSSWISIYAPPNQQAVPLELAAGFQPLDAVWIDEQEFVVCNGSRVTGFRIDNMRIEKIRDYGKKKANGPIKVVYDTHAKLLAAACEDGTLDVWEIGQHGGTQVEINAHKGAVTDLKWQPNPDYSKTELPTSFLVSSGVDGDIHVWSSRSQYTRPVHTMRMQAAVLALAFSPNGQFLAATTNSHILIWKMSDLSQPRARWVRGSEPGWQSPKTNGEMVDEYHHSLCWDSTGKRLAYGVNSMLALISFDPKAH